ncbi:MAG: NAD(P)H-dependent oxidoreductase [Bacteroidia bacterium]|nr:NAD(P)H-dependent oxidoreductase [Bacteroidia bacterium]MDW8134398.1 NAD(P)H-dependent oxidoreductase [Bacteroidia bacterium]
MSIALLSATHRPGSYTRRVSLYLAREVERRGESYHFIDFQVLPREFLFSDLFGNRSEVFQAVIQTLLLAECWLWVVPEYNGSIPGIVKVFIDALPREVFVRRAAALVGVSDGRFGNLRGLDHLSAILQYCGMRVLPFRAHLPNIRSHWIEAENQPASFLMAEIETFINHLFAWISSQR